jgi:small subunit ribosomal protein S3
MGQKTNPIGNRLGIIRGWESNWYGGSDYGDKLSEDDKIRRYIFCTTGQSQCISVLSSSVP